ISRAGHRAWDDAQHTGTSRRRSFAMHDHFAPEMSFFPGEIMMILNAADRLRPEQARHATMNHGMVRRGVLAHQVHGIPVFLTCLRVEIEPRESTKFGILFRQFLLRNRTVCRADGMSRPAAS